MDGHASWANLHFADDLDHPPHLSASGSKTNEGYPKKCLEAETAMESGAFVGMGLNTLPKPIPVVAVVRLARGGKGTLPNGCFCFFSKMAAFFRFRRSLLCKATSGWH